MPVHTLLLVENNPYPFDVRVRREATALRDAGCRVTVISPRGRDQTWKETVDGVDVWRYPNPPGGSGLLSYLFEFVYSTLAMLVISLRIRLTQRIHVVHAANPPDTLFVVGVMMKLFGAKFVFDHHDLSPETYLSRFGRSEHNVVSKTLLALERATFAAADVVIATNESYKRIAIERGRKSPQQVFVVRNGPPLSFQPVPPNEELRRQGRQLIGYIGTMGPQDGVDYLLRAVAVLTQSLDRRDVLAIVIGSGDAEPDLHALVRTLGIEEFVRFTGRIPDMQVKTLLSTVDVCVQPDPSSPLNDKSTMNKMMEYMALGKPVVAFDLAETRISGGDAAVYVRPNDEREFAQQIAALLDDPQRRHRMGAAGQAAVASRLAWEHSVPHLLAAYRDGLGLSLSAGDVPRAESPVPADPQRSA